MRLQDFFVALAALPRILGSPAVLSRYVPDRRDVVEPNPFVLAARDLARAPAPAPLDARASEAADSKPGSGTGTGSPPQQKEQADTDKTAASKGKTQAVMPAGSAVKAPPRPVAGNGAKLDLYGAELLKPKKRARFMTDKYEPVGDRECKTAGLLKGLKIDKLGPNIGLGAVGKAKSSGANSQAPQKRMAGWKPQDVVKVLASIKVDETLQQQLGTFKRDVVSSGMTNVEVYMNFPSLDSGDAWDKFAVESAISETARLAKGLADKAFYILSHKQARSIVLSETGTVALDGDLCSAPHDPTTSRVFLELKHCDIGNIKDYTIAQPEKITEFADASGIRSPDVGIDLTVAAVGNAAPGKAVGRVVMPIGTIDQNWQTRLGQFDTKVEATGMTETQIYVNLLNPDDKYAPSLLPIIQRELRSWASRVYKAEAVFNRDPSPFDENNYAILGIGPGPDPLVLLNGECLDPKAGWV